MRAALPQLGTLAARIPVAASVELAAIRVADTDGRLHLIAAAGFSRRELRAAAITPLAAVALRSAHVSGRLERHARSEGIAWLELRWLGPTERPLGTLLVASRTERRPTPDHRALLDSLAERLAERLDGTDRSTVALTGAAIALARSVEAPVATDAQDAIVLRSRERQILTLYDDGLTTDQVAALLCISTHTVRTHVKRALRTLNVHSRTEAAELVRAGSPPPLP